MQLFQFLPIGHNAFKNRNEFLISNDEFENSISQLKSKTKDDNIFVQAKSSKERKNHYLLVDCFGYAFMPEDFYIVDKEVLKGDIKLLGNIKNKHEYEKIILKYLKIRS